MVHFKILNVPSGVTFIWPGQDHDDAEDDPEARKNLIVEPEGGFTDASPGDNSLVATLEFVDGWSVDRHHRSGLQVRGDGIYGLPGRDR